MPFFISSSSRALWHRGILWSFCQIRKFVYKSITLFLSSSKVEEVFNLSYSYSVALGCSKETFSSLSLENGVVYVPLPYTHLQNFFYQIMMLCIISRIQQKSQFNTLDSLLLSPRAFVCWQENAKVLFYFVAIISSFFATTFFDTGSRHMNGRRPTHAERIMKGFS